MGYQFLMCIRDKTYWLTARQARAQNGPIDKYIRVNLSACNILKDIFQQKGLSVSVYLAWVTLDFCRSLIFTFPVNLTVKIYWVTVSTKQHIVAWYVKNDRLVTHCWNVNVTFYSFSTSGVQTCSQKIQFVSSLPWHIRFKYILT